MNNRMNFFLTSIILLISFITSFGQNEEKNTFYNLKVKVDPSSRMIECKVEIINPPDTIFILNKDMQIHSITANGENISYYTNPSKSFYAPNTSDIILRSSVVPKNIIIEYSGKINPEAYPPMLSAVNMVKPELIEMASYLTWYPKFKQGSINFELEADLPSNFKTVTNGELQAQRFEKKHNITKWKSYLPGMDIALLAAPNLQKSEINQDKVTVEIYYDKIPKSYIDSMNYNLIKSMNQLTKLFGTTNNELIRVAYSPRSAWGYVRTPFIIVSEGTSLYWRSQKYGPARDFRYLTHEISHYWWHSGNVETPEDWINEGLAEYSAFIISEMLVGKDFTNQLLSEYKERAAKCKTETAIAETENNSPDREVNRYDKPTILLNEIRNKYGEEKMINFLKSLHERFVKTKIVSTESFLDEMEKQIGKDAKDYFSNALYTKKWNNAELIQAKVN